MTINLVRYEKSVIKSDRLFQIPHLKSSSYKEGTKTLESTLGNFCQFKTSSGENKLRLHQNAIT